MTNRTDAARADALAALLATARTWRDDDPDETTRAELDALVLAAERGDTVAAADLADRFAGTLEFGTAGLRGALGAGPRRMNRAVVIRAAAGLVAWLQGEGGRAAPVVVVGFDARHGSDEFARDTAAVVTAAGGRALVLPRPLPTPVLAFAIRHLGADAGVMVTASHNPPQDNGYKVYLGDGSQIVPPVDAQIAAHIAAVGSVADVPRADDGWQTLGEELLDAYVARAAALVDADTPRDVTVVHTSLHGVGTETVQRAFAQAGLPAPQEVSSQEAPDPDFPTVAFPNPEEPGAIDAALDLAAQADPDLVVANDPDADRCAAAVRDGEGWRMLRGDELGAVLGQAAVDRLLADPTAPRRVLACSIVSSRLLAAMARAAGLEHRETLTGFKWIARVPGLAYGYEEALGYCVDPDAVQDKDGVSAALVLVQLVARLKAQGRTLTDVLDDLAVAHGVHATDAFSVRVSDLALMPALMERLRGERPEQIGGSAVERLDDLAAGSADLPPTDGLRYHLADGSRIVVRPSGTEPKVKVYLEAIEPVRGREDLARARAEAARRLAGIREDLTRLTAL
ncbi:phospho-sugar mutase [Arsenicicoccus dermatophilus]|uniref:phospho-sugar mutase n=1 Tax=Arsenicicoccus dermatophilus TaxID=1076331 RepID=UPI001F4D1B23|nr:phospho-sugar mutase [Arsenicicoccus dermatophilus]MCH8612274.1 phospho-sugar mutase [Arsenicicoccus dermatophilus]